MLFTRWEHAANFASYNDRREIVLYGGSWGRVLSNFLASGREACARLAIEKRSRTVSGAAKDIRFSAPREQARRFRRSFPADSRSSHGAPRFRVAVGRNAFVIRAAARLRIRFGERAESVLPKKRIPNQNRGDRGRREKQVVVATPAGGSTYAFMHSYFRGLRAPDEPWKKLSSSFSGATAKDDGDEEDARRDGTAVSSNNGWGRRSERRGAARKAVGVKLPRNNNTDSSWLLEEKI